MKRIEAGDPLTRSTDQVANNLNRLREVFPEAFAESKVDFDVLRQLLGDTVDDGRERYGLIWHGKRQARQLALTPSTGSLRPCPQESVSWDTTRHLMIEGDNLEVLKLLQKSYAGKVKLVYIDPPYNTGKDFVYRDDYHDSMRNYLEVTGQMNDQRKLSSNVETSGRFHTDWLNMLYPRLSLARTLLRPDGVVCVSINHTELANLLSLCSELYGERNIAGIVTWKARVKPNNVGPARFRPQKETEYVVILQKTEHAETFKPSFTGATRSYPHEVDGRAYRLATILKSNRGRNSRSTMTFEVDGYSPPDGQRWQAGKAEIRRLHEAGYVEYKDGTPFRRYFEDEEGAEHDPFYCFMDGERSSTSEAGKSELNRLLGNDHGFDTVKPTDLIRTLITSTTTSNSEDIVVDFFAGSGTTAESLMRQNLADAGNRRFILVQLPESLDVANQDQRAAAAYCDKLGRPRSIAELTKERLRRAARRIAEEHPSYAGDLGFRVFRLDTSNLRSWNSGTSQLEADLLAAIDHIEPGRTEQDLLYELLLKLGVDLCAPIEARDIGVSRVHAVGTGTLFACLGERKLGEEYEALVTGIADWHDELGAHTETTVVFRDSAFADDVTKANVAAILEQRGLSNVRSL